MPDTEAFFARLVPELSCSDFERSLFFYTNLLGFRVMFDRPEDRFAYLDLGGAQIMLEQRNDHWAVGTLEPPFGRGLNFQIEVEDVDAVFLRLDAAGVPMFREIEENWYRNGEIEAGNREFLVQDPDGYLLRFFEDLGERPAKPPSAA